jgi:CheY-like chemotaxis protein
MDLDRAGRAVRFLHRASRTGCEHVTIHLPPLFRCPALGRPGFETRWQRRPSVPIALPVVVEELAASAEQKDEFPSPAARILVIDDEDVRGTVAASLDVLGYRVREAGDGAAGLAAIQTDTPDLVVVDVAMRGMSGAEVAAAIRARHPALPIVFASGYSDTAAIEAAVGPNAHLLRKPFRIDELQVAVARAFRGPRFGRTVARDLNRSTPARRGCSAPELTPSETRRKGAAARRWSRLPVTLASFPIQAVPDVPGVGLPP